MKPGSNMIVPYGGGGHSAPSLSGRSLRAMPFWWGGEDHPEDAYGHLGQGNYRREVIVPAGQCVYSWLGCEGEPEVGNLCVMCYARDSAEDTINAMQWRELRAERRRLRKLKVNRTPERQERDRELRRARYHRYAARKREAMAA